MPKLIHLSTPKFATLRSALKAHRKGEPKARFYGEAQDTALAYPLKKAPTLSELRAMAQLVHDISDEMGVAVDLAGTAGHSVVFHGGGHRLKLICFPDNDYNWNLSGQQDLPVSVLRSQSDPIPQQHDMAGDPGKYVLEGFVSSRGLTLAQYTYDPFGNHRIKADLRLKEFRGMDDLETTPYRWLTSGKRALTEEEIITLVFATNRNSIKERADLLKHLNFPSVTFVGETNLVDCAIRFWFIKWTDFRSLGISLSSNITALVDERAQVKEGIIS
ncbi:MAG: hypothetical protein ABIA67_05360 [Candidatus Margulisiibacteriota bacterium]